MTSAMLLRLNDEIIKDLEKLEVATESEHEPDMALVLQVIQKLDAMRTQTRAEFKRVSFERFSGFLSSAMYRDFIVHPQSGQSAACTRSDDMMQLLRVNRISFHQNAVGPPSARDLTPLCSIEAQDFALSLVFAFRGNTDVANMEPSPVPVQRHCQRFEIHSLIEPATQAADESERLVKLVEQDLLPEGTRTSVSFAEAGQFPVVCYPFIAGTGEQTIHGAVWRFGVVEASGGRNVQGVCVISRFPLIEGLRAYLSAVAESLYHSTENSNTDDKAALNLFPEQSRVNETAMTTALDAGRRALSTHLTSFSSIPRRLVLPRIDVGLQDLFECLSITHILFSLVLQEKKVVLVFPLVTPYSSRLENPYNRCYFHWYGVIYMFLYFQWV